MESLVTIESNTEKLKRRFDTALEATFGVIEGKKEADDFSFVGHVDYRFDGDEKKQQLAELAVKELFQSASDLEKAEKEEKLKKLDKYSVEALALQKTGPKEIANDYILGMRRESGDVATAVFEEFIELASKHESEFEHRLDDQLKPMADTHERRMKQKYLSVRWIESGRQRREAQNFINTRFGFTTELPYIT
jgi:hypothetical protein